MDFFNTEFCRNEILDRTSIISIALSMQRFPIMITDIMIWVYYTRIWTGLNISGKGMNLRQKRKQSKLIRVGKLWFPRAIYFVWGVGLNADKPLNDATSIHLVNFGPIYNLGICLWGERHARRAFSYASKRLMRNSEMKRAKLWLLRYELLSGRRSWNLLELWIEMLQFLKGLMIGLSFTLHLGRHFRWLRGKKMASFFEQSEPRGAYGFYIS